MMLFGHKFIPSNSLFHVSGSDAIKKTPPLSIIFVEFSEENLDLIHYIIENKIELALNVENITQIIYANALGASYILVSPKLAKTAQNLANNYLFDAKILIHIQDEDEIEEMALLGVDGVIFKEAIVKINS